MVNFKWIAKKQKISFAIASIENESKSNLPALGKGCTTTKYVLIHMHTLKKLSGHFWSPSYAFSEPWQTSIEHHVSMQGFFFHVSEMKYLLKCPYFKKIVKRL